MSFLVRSPLVLAESLIFSAWGAGWKPTLKLAWHRCFGKEEWFGFVRYLEPEPASPLLPRDVNGFTIRPMQRESLDAAAALAPASIWRLPLHRRREQVVEWLGTTLVAERGGRLVGIISYRDCSNTAEPWREILRFWLREPVWMTKFFYVVPGERGAAWALASCGNDWCASQGVRCVVAFIRTDNRPSLLVTRLLGGKLVCRMVRRYRFGREEVEYYPVSEEEASELLTVSRAV